MQRNSEKTPKIFIFVEISRSRYLDRRSIEPSPLRNTSDNDNYNNYKKQ
jgi:hypothetical protein